MLSVLFNRMFRRLLLKLHSPFNLFVFLLITLVFCVITILIQSFLIELNSTRRYKYRFNESKNLKRDLNLYEQDLLNCDKLLKLDLHLQDLVHIKKSYLNELKQIESKHADLTASVNQLKDQVSLLKFEYELLQAKSLTNKQKILNQNLKLTELDSILNHKSNLLSLANLQINLISNLSSSNFKLIYKKPSLEGCFKFKNCYLHSKIRVYIYSSSKLNSTDFFKQIKFKSLNYTIQFVSKPRYACLSIIFLVRQVSHLTYYQKLPEFLLKQKQNSNYLFLNLDQHQFESKQKLGEFLFSLNRTNDLSVWTNLLACSFFASFSNEQNRDNFYLDFSLIYNPNLGSNLTKKVNLIKERKYLISYFSKDQSEKFKFIKKLYQNNSNILIDLNSNFSDLVNSKFTLLVPEENLSITQQLVESLRAGTIPILVDLDYKLPLDSLIAWDEIIIKIPFYRITYLIPILKSLNFYEITSRQIKARNIYTAYFSSLTKQFKTLISALKNRLRLPASVFSPVENITELVYSNSSKKPLLIPSVEIEPNQEYLGDINQPPLNSDEYTSNFTYSNYILWNKVYYPHKLFPSNPFELSLFSDNKYTADLEQKFDMDLFKKENFTYGGGDGKYFNNYLSGNFKDEQFTIVILTYKREKIMSDFLIKYLQLPYLNSILIVWNSVDDEPSEEFRIKFEYYLSIRKLRIIKVKRNSLNNRFLPFDFIKTDAVLSLDDDTSLRPDEIMLAFRVWRENRDRIVGFPARYHTWDFSMNNYVYTSYLSCEYSMVLTGAAFYHRFYNYYYSYIMDSRIRRKIDELMNCEDIAFNMMVAHLTRKSPIKVTTKYSFYCAECESLANNTQNDLPVSLKIGHYERRNECFRTFIRIYGYNPLVYSQFRADSVLYKTKLPPHKQKCFKLI